MEAHVAAPRKGRPDADEVLGDAVGAEPEALTKWDGLISEDTHFVDDGAEIEHLTEERRRIGADELGATTLDDDTADHPDTSSQRGGFLGVDMALLNLAERRAGERAAGAGYWKKLVRATSGEVPASASASG